MRHRQATAVPARGDLLPGPDRTEPPGSGRHCPGLYFHTDWLVLYDWLPQCDAGGCGRRSRDARGAKGQHMDRTANKAPATEFAGWRTR